MKFLLLSLITSIFSQGYDPYYDNKSHDTDRYNAKSHDDPYGGRGREADPYGRGREADPYGRGHDDNRGHRGGHDDNRGHHGGRDDNRGHRVRREADPFGKGHDENRGGRDHEEIKSIKRSEKDLEALISRLESRINELEQKVGGEGSKLRDENRDDNPYKSKESNQDNNRHKSKESNQGNNRHKSKESGGSSKGAGLDVEKMLDLVNIEREKVGVHPLKINGQLMEAAKMQAVHMNDINQATHDGPPGNVQLGDRLETSGYGRNVWQSENVAKGQNDEAQAMDSWMHSEGHRTNLLNKSYKEAGFANVNKHWVQVFCAKP